MKVFVADDISPLGLEKLQDLPEVEVFKQTGLAEDQLIQQITDADALLVRSQTKVTRRVLEAAKQLKVIGRAGVGVDNIDVTAATERGVVVLNAPDGNTLSAAEHTFAMLMSLARHIPQARQSMMEHRWDRKTFVGVELAGKTLGIIGMGRIGAEVAKRAKAFQMKLVGYDPFLSDEKAKTLGVTLKPLEEAVKEADFLTVHTPLTKETRHLVNKNLLDTMKQGVRIINCARGGIIDERALYEAILSGRVAGAAIDVFETEPLPEDSPLLNLPQVIMTPHLGASTVEAQVNVAVSVAEEVGNVLLDKPFKNAVNLPSLTEHQKQYLQPYLELSEKLGRFVGLLSDGPISNVEMLFTGELEKEDTSFMARSTLKGLLGHRYGDEVNFVNAPLLAEQAGLKVRQIYDNHSHIYTDLLTLSVESQGMRHSVAGTLFNGLGPRIVDIDGYSVDADITGNLIYTRHSDRPGMVGHIGSLLGKADVNIAGMKVGRKETGGEAVMLMSVDKEVAVEVVEELSRFPGIHVVKTINI